MLGMAYLAKAQHEDYIPDSMYSLQTVWQVLYLSLPHFLVILMLWAM